MSEIKGQILGVVLVLAIFGAIGTVLVSSFTKSADTIKNKMSEADTSLFPNTSNSDSSGTQKEESTKFNSNDLFEIELLTF